MGPYSVVCIFVVLPVCTDMYTVVFYKFFTYVHVFYALYSVHVLLFMLYTVGHVQFCVFISYVLAIVIVFMCVLRHWHLLFPVATGCRMSFSVCRFVRDAVCARPDCPGRCLCVMLERFQHLETNFKVLDELPLLFSPCGNTTMEISVEIAFEGMTGDRVFLLLYQV